MNLQNVKAQASRLATYLGSNHRVSLKRASALEAVAQMHGAKNWQTLLASLDADNAPAAAETTRAKGTNWLSSRGMDERHALVTGPKSKSLPWIAEALGEHIDQGRFGVFVGVPDNWRAVLESAGVQSWSGEAEVSRRSLQVVFDDDLVRLEATCVSKALRQLVAETGSKTPFTVMACSRHALPLIPPILLEQGRGANLQVLMNYESDEEPDARVAGNSYTRVVLEMTAAAESDLLQRARRAPEVWLTGDQGAHVPGRTRLDDLASRLPGS